MGLSHVVRKPSLVPVLLIAALAGGLTLVFLLSLRANTPVVVASRPIAVGARLAEGDLAVKMVRSADKLPHAVDTIPSAVGQVISVQRLPGDEITTDMLGSQAFSAIAAGLPVDHRAVAINVTRSSGLDGIIRPGDFVTLIAVVSPDSQLSTIVSASGTPTPAGSQSVPNVKQGTSTPEPSPTALVPDSPFARVTATGIKVLLVPQTFQYQEASSSSLDSQGFAAAQTSLVGQQNSVIVVDVPVTPITIVGAKGPTTISLPELMALLDAHAQIYMALEPPTGAAAAHYPGVAIQQIVNLGVGQ
jgi:Flp pilus assembly protein CpaB